jgi:glycosyltransferase involved in cell wall biosynthesis
VPLVIDWIDWWGRGGLIKELRPAWYQYFFGGIEAFYEEHYRTRADALTVISSALAERAVGLGVPHDRIFKVQDGGEPGFFTPRPSLENRGRYALPTDAFIVGFSAADVTMDVGLALAAIARARRECPQILLLLTGNRPSNFERQVEAAGLAGGYQHLGFLPYAELPVALSCADAFLLPFPDKPANRGRWPHKIADYMCLARPTVTNPVGEMRLLLEKEPVGLLAEANAEAMGRRLVELARDPDLRDRLGRHARHVATEHFVWSRVVDQVEACYKQAAMIFGRKQGQLS